VVRARVTGRDDGGKRHVYSGNFQNPARLLCARRDRLTESLGALALALTPAHLFALAKAVPVNAAAGTRYPQEHLAHMNSEKRSVRTSALA
jgi:hypothetical protein